MDVSERRSRDVAAKPTGRDNAKELAALQRQIDRLHGDLGALRAESAGTALRGADGDAQPLSYEEQEQRFLDHVAEVDSAFQNEPRDRAWADEAAKAIRAAVDSEHVKSGLVTDIECHSRTCKLELGDAARHDLDAAIDHLVHELATALPNATIGHDGNLQQPKPNALYFARAVPGDDVPVVLRR